MKFRNITILFVLLGFTAFAQEPADSTAAKEEVKYSDEIITLLGSDGNTIHGGYGALSMGYTRIKGRDALIIGGKGSWLVNHQFGIGLAGEMVMSEQKEDEVLGSDYFFAGGYGGMLLEYILMPRNPIHASFPLLIGAGGISYKRGEYNPSYNDPLEDSGAYFIIEPGAELDINIAKFIRMSFGIYYRYTSDINMFYFKTGRYIEQPNFFKNISAKIALKFGKF